MEKFRHDKTLSSASRCWPPYQGDSAGLIEEETSGSAGLIQPADDKSSPATNGGEVPDGDSD